MTTNLLRDGFKTFYSFALDADVELAEISVKPPGIDAGGEIDIATMRSTAWRGKSPKQLKTLTTSTARVAYDTQLYSSILLMVGKNQLITVTLPDTATYAFYGWIDKFEP